MSDDQDELENVHPFKAKNKEVEFYLKSDVYNFNVIKKYQCRCCAFSWYCTSKVLNHSGHESYSTTVDASEKCEAFMSEATFFQCSECKFISHFKSQLLLHIKTSHVNKKRPVIIKLENAHKSSTKVFSSSVASAMSCSKETTNKKSSLHPFPESKNQDQDYDVDEKNTRRAVPWCNENYRKRTSLAVPEQSLLKKPRIMFRDPKNYDEGLSHHLVSQQSNQVSRFNDGASSSRESNSDFIGTSPIDVAAHLKITGDSLTKIGQKLKEQQGPFAVTGAHSLLLDSLLSALGPILCLTTQILGLEHLDQNKFKKILDHISFFMPCLEP